MEEAYASIRHRLSSEEVRRDGRVNQGAGVSCVGTLEPGEVDLSWGLITLDTLRADRLGLYGYDRPTSPSLDALSSDSLVFLNAISPSSWTLPAHASMFTGLFPRRHGAHFTEERSSQLEAYFGARALASNHLTLAEVLAASGYETAGFVSNFGLLTRETGMSQGFELFDDRPGRIWGYEPTLHAWLRVYPHVLECLSKSYRPAARINDQVFRWLAARPGRSRPFFLFINYMDPHSPYCPPGSLGRLLVGRDLRIGEPESDVFRGRELTHEEKQHFRAVYEGEISYLDFSLGRIVARIQEAGLYEDALVIVTSDHGEYFGEHHLWGHGYGPYDEVYHVPLLVKYPRRARVGIENGYVSTLDVFTTVLDEAGIDPPVGVDSVVLDSPPRTIVVEQYGNTHLAGYYGERFKRSFRALYKYPWKYVAFSDGEELLLELSRDPDETTDLLSRRQDVATFFRDYLKEWLEETNPYSPIETQPGLSPEQLKRLRALGYLE